MDEHLFPALPEDLGALTDDELNELLAQSVAAKDKIVADDSEFLAGRTAEQVIGEMKAGVDGILRLKSEQASRVEASEAYQEQLQTLAAQVADTDTLDADTEAPEADEAPADEEPTAEVALETEEPEAAVEAVEEPVVAAAAPRVLRRLPAAGRHTAITSDARDGMTLVASASLSGFKPGEPLTNKRRLDEALCAALNTQVAAPAGFSDKVIVAHGEVENMPAWRRASGNDLTTRENLDKIEALTAAAMEYGITDDPDALLASGGVCAPVTPYYQLANVSTVQRPVRDAMVGYIADRGGIRYMPPPVISDFASAVGAVTADNDKLGGTFATKNCMTIICPDQVEVDVTSIYHCLTAGNLGARAFPEQIAQASALTLAYHARFAEALLLNAIKAGSHAVTANGQATNNDGIVATLLNDVLLMAAGMRSRNRMIKDTRLQAILPAWTADMLVADLAASQFQRFAYNQAGVEALLETYGINVAWTLDGPSTGTGQVFGAQGDTAIVDWPSEVQWALFPAGSWLFVDSGVLELGIVRDSVLNATNSYQIFGESWEAAAGIGVESDWVTSTVCASGIVSQPVAPTGC